MFVIPEFMIRVKLPSPDAFPACPSGDTDYEIARDKALADARPEGFEYIYPRMGESWPRDSEGYTFARLRCSDHDNALATFRGKAERHEDRLRQLVVLLGEAQRVAGDFCKNV
jgi:hypothetical protein